MSTTCRAAKKRKKRHAKEEEEPPPPLWTTLESIPAEPPKILADAATTTIGGNDEIHEKDKNEKERADFKIRLEDSLVKAVREGNADFVRQVLETPRTRGVLCLLKHDPQTTPTGGMGEVYKLMGETPPVQPYFGLRELICGSLYGNLRRTNLLIEAIKRNQLEVVRELIKLGFDINASYSSNGAFHTHPLLTAITDGSIGIVDLLLDQIHIIVTHPGTRTYNPRNGQSRPRCDPTALSAAADEGQLSVVQKLIQHGALQRSSTRRNDDPYPILSDHDAEKLVGLSIKEALVNAYDKADPETPLLHRNGCSVQTFADILELLLSQTGTQKNNVITVYVLDRIMRDDWNDIHFPTMYSYSYRLDEDRDFDMITGSPGARARAVARGLRPPHEVMSRGGATPEGPAFLKEKYQQWNQLVATCRERLAAAGPNWISAVDEAMKAPRSMEWHWHIKEARQNRQMMFWCHLFASPWSKKRHTCYPTATRGFVKELLHIGSSLDRMHGLTGGLKEMWDKEILPLAIE